MPCPSLREAVRELQVLLLPCHLIETDERKLDLLMPGNPVTFAGSEDGHHVVSHSNAYVQQFLSVAL